MFQRRARGSKGLLAMSGAYQGDSWRYQLSEFLGHFRGIPGRFMTFQRFKKVSSAFRNLLKPFEMLKRLEISNFR